MKYGTDKEKWDKAIVKYLKSPEVILGLKQIRDIYNQDKNRYQELEEWFRNNSDLTTEQIDNEIKKWLEYNG